MNGTFFLCHKDLPAKAPSIKESKKILEEQPNLFSYGGRSRPFPVEPDNPSLGLSEFNYLFIHGIVFGSRKDISGDGCECWNGTPRPQSTSY